MILKQALFLLSAAAMLTGSASAADFPVKAPAAVEQPRQVSGYVELYGGWSRVNTDETFCTPTCASVSDQANGWVLGGAGRATWWWAPSLSVQLDAQGDGTSYRFESKGGSFQRVSTHNYLIGGHANWRDPQRGLIGFFGGAGDATNVLQSSSPVRHGLIGAEAQYYLGPVTLYGQGGYNSTLGDLSSFANSIHAWFARGTGRLYLIPNFRLEGTVLYASGSVSFASLAPPGSLDFRTWLWRAKGEYRFATTPFSLFAAYEGSRSTVDQSITIVPNTFTVNARFTDHRIIGGLRLYLNEGTLQANDRNGTTLDIIAPFAVPSFAFGQGLT
jgi:hypothetical protein